MIDIHSHILPAVDDGAKSPQESAALLEQMTAQGVTAAVATPHFYPGESDLRDFLSLRQNALQSLENHCGKDLPVKILPGAEVLYFGGIGGVESIRQLTLAGSKYLLLELLGLKKIDEKVIKDIISLKENLGITPIIAHVERYRRCRGYKKLFSLFESGAALCQINASFVTSLAESRAVKRLVKAGLVDFIASDCHNPLTRPVRLQSALDAVCKISVSGAQKIIEKNDKFEKELCAL